jgi:hypothetical protein
MRTGRYPNPEKHNFIEDVYKHACVRRINHLFVVKEKSSNPRRRQLRLCFEKLWT